MMKPSKLICLGDTIFKIINHEADGRFLVEIYKDAGFFKIDKAKLDYFINQWKEFESEIKEGKE